MVQTISAQDLTLHDVKEKFSLKQVEDKQVEDEQFFPQWQTKLPEDKFSLRRGNDLYTVLSLVKRLVALISQTQN